MVSDSQPTKFHSNQTLFLRANLVNNYWRIADGIDVSYRTLFFGVKLSNDLFVVSRFDVEEWVSCWVASLCQVRQRFYKYVVRLRH